MRLREESVEGFRMRCCGLDSETRGGSWQQEGNVKVMWLSREVESECAEMVGKNERRNAG